MVLHAGVVLVKPGYRRSKPKQNRCVRSIFFVHSRDSAMSYFNLLEILTLENIYKFKLALFMHKINYDPTNIPAIFSGTLTLASSIVVGGTRTFFKPNFCPGFFLTTNYGIKYSNQIL